MNKNQHTPCSSCPYRKSAPVGLWAPEEFKKLLEQDQSLLGGVPFGCHLQDGSLCRGWVADQKRRGVPCMLFRAEAMMRPGTADLLLAVDEEDPDLCGLSPSGRDWTRTKTSTLERELYPLRYHPKSSASWRGDAGLVKSRPLL